jgi:hypothetical protein
MNTQLEEHQRHLVVITDPHIKSDDPEYLVRRLSLERMGNDETNQTIYVREPFFKEVFYG